MTLSNCILKIVKSCWIKVTKGFWTGLSNAQTKKDEGESKNKNFNFMNCVKGGNIQCLVADTLFKLKENVIGIIVKFNQL